MTRPTPRTTTRNLILAVIALAAVAAGAGFWILFVRGTPPAPVGAASQSPGTTHAAVATTPASSASAGATSGPGGSGTTWTVDTSIGSFTDFSDSFVGYRVNETLAGNKANTAVGRTPAVSGTLTLDGQKITSVQVTADLGQLQSDDQRRDGQLRNQAIETSRFPQSTFALTQPIDLGAVPADGSTFDVSATGDLTLHGVTKSVTIPLHANVSGDVVTVTGSIEIQFADFSIQQPSSFFVLSIEDHGTLELQLHFRRG
ncbi:MAG TPA: YceI family protein [Candidatus Limnocylindrales bacterium]|nr:YceI family protein [Candidatus Limnocylindrales bacterium]